MNCSIRTEHAMMRWLELDGGQRSCGLVFEGYILILVSLLLSASSAPLGEQLCSMMLILQDACAAPHYTSKTLEAGSHELRPLKSPLHINLFSLRFSSQILYHREEELTENGKQTEISHEWRFTLLLCFLLLWYKMSLTKSDLWNKEFILAHDSRARIHNGGKHGRRWPEQEAADHIIYSKQEAKQVNCKWHEALNSQSPPPVMYFL